MLCRGTALLIPCALGISGKRFKRIGRGLTERDIDQISRVHTTLESRLSRWQF
jgi:hypothetical protein